MLHEVLLALSGHPSPLFQKPDADGESDTTVHSLLSPSEASLLESIGRLAERHRQIRDHVQWIVANHQSTICRAVATSIQQTYLARFQKKVLGVERGILTKDATVVGAYDIVPLATIVGEFDDWHRLMLWLWEIATSMQPEATPNKALDARSDCTGASLINKLRLEANTGFPEIESAATELSSVAELAWLKQLAPWVVHGKISAHGADDFFIRAEQGNHSMFCKAKELIPQFVAPATASSIVFIGACLHRIRHLSQQSRVSATSSMYFASDTRISADHLQHISSLSLPISQGHLSRAVSAIRLSLSQNVLQRLLPMHDITELLSCLRRYFLLGEGEFPIALIDEAETRLQARQQSMGRLLQQDPVKALQGLSIKDAELHQALSSTWKRSVRDEHAEDHVLEFARKHMTLAASNGNSARPASSDSVSIHVPQVSPVAFNDLLFPTAIVLGLHTVPPLDLFISAKDIDTYAAINAYLLAVRRAQVRLSELWRRTSARREHASKATTAKRTRDIRKIWATSSAALHLISETAAYLEGEVVKGSCEHFETWVEKPTSSEDGDSSLGSVQIEPSSDVAQRDPETLSAAHRAFLAALTYAVLLTDVHYTRELRSLLGNIDALIAFFTSMFDVQQKLDLETDAGGESSYTVEEEQRISVELDRARKKVDSDLRSVINRLRQLDHERIGSGRYIEVGTDDSGGFEPWKGGGVDRLLMKLEFGRIRDDGYDIV